jgi:tRNA dimethylallyltransferase
MEKTPLIAIIGPTASGKSAKAVSLAKERGGEIISVDSRQVYRGLDIGTEKITREEMGGITHHLIDIRNPKEVYTAGDFVTDAKQLIKEIIARDKIPILAGGTHFYFDALIYGLPVLPEGNKERRAELEQKTPTELYSLLLSLDSVRAQSIEKENPRRLIRAIEIAEKLGTVPLRERRALYDVTWYTLLPHKEDLRARIHTRLEQALIKGLVEEVARVQKEVGDTRLNELGLEYRIIGEYLRGERDKETLFETLETKLWRYAKNQILWIKKLTLV